VEESHARLAVKCSNERFTFSSRFLAQNGWLTPKMSGMSRSFLIFDAHRQGGTPRPHP